MRIGGRYARRAFWRALIVLSLVTGLASARGVPIYEATPAQLKRAQQTFEAGDRLYEAGEYDQAIAAFRASHEIVASPNSTLMIARSYRELGKLREAHASFRAAQTEAKEAAARDKNKYKATLEAIEQEAAELNAKLGKVQVELVNAPSGTDLMIGNDRIPQDAISDPIPVAAGNVTVTAIDPSGTKVSRDVKIAAGQTEKVTLEFTGTPSPAATEPIPKQELPPPDEPATPPGEKREPSTFPNRTWAYVAGGVGVAGLVTFGIFGALSKSKYDQLEKDCVDDHCPPDRGSDIDRGKSYQTIANVGLAIGVVGIGTGVAFWLLSPKPTNEPKSAKIPRVRVGLGSVAIESRF